MIIADDSQIHFSPLGNPIGYTDSANIFWSIGRVQKIRDDLDDDQAMEVLLNCSTLDMCGLDVEMIKSIADFMYPRSKETPDKG